MADSHSSSRAPDVLPRDRRIDGRKERAGRSVDSAMAYGLLLTIAKQDQEIVELRRQAGPPLMTSDGVAERLGVSPGSIRRWADAGQLSSIRLPGGERRFSMEDVTALLAACERHQGTS